MEIINLNLKMLARIDAAIEELGISRQTFIETALDAALRPQETKASAPNPVGRPRLSAQEKQFRDAVRDIDEIYLSLENEYLGKPGVFNELFGSQLAIYKEAVEAKDYSTIQWWQQNAPWQKKNPADFINLWVGRES